MLIYISEIIYHLYYPWVSVRFTPICKMYNTEMDVYFFARK